MLDGKLTRLVLSSRPGVAIMPKVNLIDMRAQPAEALSKPLVARMRHYLDDNKQVMLFINRRGYAPVFSVPNVIGVQNVTLVTLL